MKFQEELDNLYSEREIGRSENSRNTSSKTERIIRNKIRTIKEYSEIKGQISCHSQIKREGYWIKERGYGVSVYEGLKDPITGSILYDPDQLKEASEA